ncbi:patatin-like phospholipase family protein [Desulfosarcina sp. OttesenSCG-928-B08]|nr:patatin-like phospholipase family protein [Desulfosarcina sp. OttesenSCG-928-B08]
MSEKPSFNSVVFAGGGCRSVWQVGFWSVTAGPLGLDQAVIGATSAGAAMACLVRSGRTEEGLLAFKSRFARNPRNMYLNRIGTGLPVFPQEALYREGIVSVLDSEALDRLLHGPDIRVLLAIPPKGLPPPLATGLGIAAYSLEKHLLRPMHPVWAQKLGFRPQVVSVKTCKNADDVANLILQSSCTPPFVAIQYRDHQPALDGGLVDNCPVLAVADVEGPMLVLLTRRYPPDRFPETRNRLYLQPSAPPPVARWDYTDASGLQATFDLGREDGERFLERWEKSPVRG